MSSEGLEKPLKFQNCTTLIMHKLESQTSRNISRGCFEFACRCPKGSVPDKVYFFYQNLKARATIFRCLFKPFSYSYNIRSCFSLEDDRVSLFPLDYFASSCFEWSVLQVYFSFGQIFLLSGTMGITGCFVSFNSFLPLFIGFC